MEMIDKQKITIREILEVIVEERDENGNIRQTIQQVLVEDI